jgi:hypothetical protein
MRNLTLAAIMKTQLVPDDIIGRGILYPARKSEAVFFRSLQRCKARSTALQDLARRAPRQLETRVEVRYDHRA